MGVWFGPLLLIVDRLFVIMMLLAYVHSCNEGGFFLALTSLNYASPLRYGLQLPIPPLT